MGLRFGYRVGSRIDYQAGLGSDFGLDLPPKPSLESSSDPVYALAPPHASSLYLVPGPNSLSALEVPMTTGIE